MNKKSLVDLADRVGATFGQAFLAYVVAVHATNVRALYAAGAAAGLAVAKFLLVKANAYLGKPDTQ